MKKRLAALLCALLLTASALPSALALEGEGQRAADTLVTLGLLENAAYDLAAPATRAQAAVLLVGLSGGTAAAAADNWISGFRDVPAAITDEVNYASHQGWITGVTATQFRPDSPLTANAWSAFILRMLGYSDREGDFSIYEAAVFAQRIGLFPAPYPGVLTQAELFETAMDVLAYSRPDSGATVAQELVSQGALSRTAANAVGLLRPTLTARQVADRCSAAVIRLDTYASEDFWEEGLATGEASGFFITEDGLAVTNCHSIEDTLYATATLSTGEVYPVESVLYYDDGIDIAVLKISQTSLDGKETSAFATLDIAPSGTGDLRAGDAVYAIGNPLGLGLAVSSGVVSATDREVERYALPCVMSTADISEGSSGGALLNAYGQVVAVTAGAYVYGNSMYLAVPIDPILTLDLSGEGQSLSEVSEVISSED